MPFDFLYVIISCSSKFTPIFFLGLFIEMIEFIKMYPFSVNYPLKNKLNKNVKNFMNDLLISLMVYLNFKRYFWGPEKTLLKNLLKTKEMKMINITLIFPIHTK